DRRAPLAARRGTRYKDLSHEPCRPHDQLHARRPGRRSVPRPGARRMRGGGAARAQGPGPAVRAERGVPAAARVAGGAPRGGRRAAPGLLDPCPDLRDPSGATATLAPRRGVAELPAEQGFWILEGAPYRPLRYRGAEVVSLHELIPARTLHMSSFTKQISPGV